MRTVSVLLVATTWAVLGAVADQPSPGSPPGEAGAKAALNASPRHGEWIDVPVPGRAEPLRCYVVYPERSTQASVVIVIHEIFGLTDWIRAVADHLAADGFISLAPDLLTGLGPDGGGTEAFDDRDDVVKAVRALQPADVISALNAVRQAGLNLPAASGRSAAIGFCWGGTESFRYATAQPELNAAVVYYGTNPSDPATLARIKAPLLGLYGADDARVTATIEPAAAELKKLGKPYTHHLYQGAGHGFLRAQDGRDGANLKAAQQAWPATIEFLRQHTR
ncbi:dienelactone hydrolase family protein [bacterium]|nr:dienelactone hydrolase family protein [bacterium]